MRTVLFGQSWGYTERVLRRLVGRVELVGIVEPAPASGNPRGPLASAALRALGRPNLKAAAALHGVQYLPYIASRAEELAGKLRALGAEVGCIASFPRLLPRCVFEAFPAGVLNLHPSLLPAYRGPNPIFWQYLWQERTGGVSVHFVDEKEDHGDLVAQAPLPIGFGTSGLSHLEACGELGATLLVDALDLLARGTLKRTPQAQAGAFRARSLVSGERVLDFATQSLEHTFHALRGGDAMLDVLLPPSPSPLRAFDLVPVSYDHAAPRGAPGTWNLSGSGLTLNHAEGRIRVQVRPSLTRLRRTPWRTLFRTGPSKARAAAQHS